MTAHILSDLQAFDKKYLNGVDPPSFQIVNENGGPRYSYQSISALQDPSSGEITVTSPTALPSSVTKGSSVTIAEMSDADYDGKFNVDSVDASTNSFTYHEDPNSGLVNMRPATGGTLNNPVNTPETALDVEWVHALAPQAKILLVEKKSSEQSVDVDPAVETAVKMHASIISMSFGTNVDSDDDVATDLDRDKTVFNAPNVAYIASSGDAGDQDPGTYPSDSPNVLSVGATNLYLNDDGSYNMETGWSNPANITDISERPGDNVVTVTTDHPTGLEPGGFITISNVNGKSNDKYNGTFQVVAAPDSTQFSYLLVDNNGNPIKDLPEESGGTAGNTGENGGGSGGERSAFESQPTYQVGVVPTSMSTVDGVAHRTTPDVSFIGGQPTPAVAIDSYSVTPESDANIDADGTSLSAPCWAALVAIIDQGRA